MLFSGVQKLTLLDFPRKTACILFTPGCNLRCGFCHNPEFVLPQRLQEIAPSFIAEETVLNFLQERRGLLEGVVITGGEPTITRGLEEFIRHVKDMDYLVKLDTNGTNPDVMGRLLAEDLLDYVAMDYKISFARYPSLVGGRESGEKARRSMEILRQASLPHEFRSTVIREVHTPEVIEEMQKEIDGAENYYLQDFRPAITLKEEFGKYHGFGEAGLQALTEAFRPHVAHVGIRV